MTEQDLKNAAAVVRMVEFSREHGLSESTLTFSECAWCCQMSHPEIDTGKFCPTNWDERLDLAIQASIAEAHALLLRWKRGEKLETWYRKVLGGESRGA